jgi:ABC-type phosphate transport system substrate-binding protein
MTSKTAMPGLALLATLLTASAGCDTLLGGGYAVGADDGPLAPRDSGGPPVDARAPSDAAIEAQADAEGGTADACATDPQTKSQFESACGGNATCAPFDNTARNTLCGTSGVDCPRVPAPDAGSTDGGIVDAGTSEAGALDASPLDAPAGDDATDGDATSDDGGASDLDATTGDAETGSHADGGPTYPSCFSLTHGPMGGSLPTPIVYATGSTAIQPYVARVAQVLESLSIGSVVYLGAGSCFGINAMTDPADYPLRRVGATATFYDPALDVNGNVQTGTCAIDDPARLADVGISDVFPTTCDPDLASQGGLPNNLHDFFGPVQVMELIVPATSTQTSISAEAAYMVWGYGSASGVAPWTDESFLLQRSSTSGTQNMIGAAIGLSPAQWHGVKNATSSAILGAIENIVAMRAVDGGPASDPMAAEKAMGILASDVADNNRQVLRPLAFQDVGQACGWYPDSTPSSFDKTNVRDGRYPIWGPSHFVVYADSNGNPTNAAAKSLIDALSGTNAQILPTLDIVQFYAKSHIIPTCAMHVTRTSDGHDYAPYSPPISCSCYYDRASTGQTTCVPCKSDSDCKNAPQGATTCVNIFGLPPVGYCEQPGSPH